MSDLIDRQATIDYLIANVPHDDYGDELDADELREMWTERINKIPPAEPHLVNESQGLVKDLVNREDALCSIEQYIDKFDFIDVNFLDGLKTAMELIKELPTAEPQIVRCKDCEKERRCKFTQYQGENGYCSLAERRTDEEVQDNS